MGIVQKIFYFHVPSAYAMYLGADGVLRRLGRLPRCARPTRATPSRAPGPRSPSSSASSCSPPGPLWGAKAWGTFWTWDPRLTTALLSVLIYVAYLVLRAFAGDGEGERRFAAALGILGAANLPIIHFSVQKWGGQHPMVITGSGRRPAAPGHEDRARRSASSRSRCSPSLLLWARTRLEIAREPPAPRRGRRDRPRARHEDRSMSAEAPADHGAPAAEPRATTPGRPRDDVPAPSKGEPEQLQRRDAARRAPTRSLWVILLAWVALVVAQAGALDDAPRRPRARRSTRPQQAEPRPTASASDRR